MQVAMMLTQIAEVPEMMVPAEHIEVILSHTSQLADASVWIVGFLLFFVIVVLGYFAYKFFRIFF